MLSVLFQSSATTVCHQESNVPREPPPKFGRITNQPQPMYDSSPTVQQSPAQHPLPHNKRISSSSHISATASFQQLQQQQQEPYYAQADHVNTASSAQIMYASKQHPNLLDYTHAGVNVPIKRELYDDEEEAITTVIDLSMIGPMIVSVQKEVKKLHTKIDILLNNIGASVFQAPPSHEKFKKIETIEELDAFNNELKSDPELTAKWVSTMMNSLLIGSCSRVCNCKSHISRYLTSIPYVKKILLLPNRHQVNVLLVFGSIISLPESCLLSAPGREEAVTRVVRKLPSNSLNTSSTF